MTTSFDVAVIGGGVGGASCAIRLARAGSRVVLFEKEPQTHHKVCGEFLSAEALPLLTEVGIDLDAYGASHITSVGVHGQRMSMTARLPQAGRGLSRLRLDEELLRNAEAAGVWVLRGERVRTLESVDGTRFRVLGEQTAHVVRDVVCATGKSDFRPVQTRQGRDSEWVGFKIHVHLRPESRLALQERIELFVFDGGYAGLCHVEGFRQNLCFLLDRARAREAPRRAEDLLRWLAVRTPALSLRLKGADALMPLPKVVAPIPYGFVRTEPASWPQVYAIGDQAAVIPSLTGDGMAIALMSARRAADHILQGGSPERFQKEMADAIGPQVAFAYRLHQIFRSPRWADRALALMRVMPALSDWAFFRTRVRIAEFNLAK
ncbi:MAG: FAD-dependent oxidoreductase [Bdellovibrionaceae bacterium]|nr:FAD-dependent oxidoreductase [Pseudobdellovibrionaceae bacterium]